MNHLELSNAFQDALTKAFATCSPQARLAYFDLAQFYRKEMGRQLRHSPLVRR